MSFEDNHSHDLSELRRKAEEVAIQQAKSFAKDGVPLSASEAQKTLHDLKVHQIELEMQNEELRTTLVDLETSREQYFELYDLAPVGYCTVNEHGLILEANLTVATLLGKAGRAAFLKQPITHFIYPDDQDIYYMHRKWLFETGGTQECELRMMKEDGTIIWVHLQATSRQEKDGEQIYRVILSDITDRKLAEEAIRTANKKLQILSSITRHDILNKIIVIQGYLDLSRPKIDDPKLSKYLIEINSAAHEIRRQIDFTRAYEDLGVMEPTWHSVKDLINVISDSMLPVRADCSGYQVLADPMIPKVFSNLMDNTIRHAEGVTRVEIHCEEREGALMICWEDDGPGIPDDQKERIFERSVGKNNGFGLFLSREILGITGISIRETGICGEGARFEMRVPKGIWASKTVSFQ